MLHGIYLRHFDLISTSTVRLSYQVSLNVKNLARTPCTFRIWICRDERKTSTTLIGVIFSPIVFLSGQNSLISGSGLQRCFGVCNYEILRQLLVRHRLDSDLESILFRSYMFCGGSSNLSRPLLLSSLPIDCCVVTNQILLQSFDLNI